jgi:flagellar hook-basal body complex protein FliE
MDTSAIDNLLAQLRVARPPAGAAAAAARAGAPGQNLDFAAMLKNSVAAVNASQVDAVRRARDFELGVPEANLNDAMIAMQKANLSFQQMVQVRNRLVSAYHDIMNMQV